MVLIIIVLLLIGTLLILSAIEKTSIVDTTKKWFNIS